jgi:hypothetical protein
VKLSPPSGLSGLHGKLTEADISAKITAAILRDQTLLKPLDLAKYNGPKGRIYCYVELDGSCPSLEFLEQIKSGAVKGYATSFAVHCLGVPLRGEKHHIWPGYESLGEYKHNPTKTRIMHTYENGNTHVLLFGFGSKTEDDVDSEHVSRAIKMQKEYRQRRDEIDTRIRKECNRGGINRG